MINTHRITINTQTSALLASMAEESGQDPQALIKKALESLQADLKIENLDQTDKDAILRLRAPFEEIKQYYLTTIIEKNSTLKKIKNDFEPERKTLAEKIDALTEEKKKLEEENVSLLKTVEEQKEIISNLSKDLERLKNDRDGISDLKKALEELQSQLTVGKEILLTENANLL